VTLRGAVRLSQVEDFLAYDNRANVYCVTSGNNNSSSVKSEEINKISRVRSPDRENY